MSEVVARCIALEREIKAQARSLSIFHPTLRQLRGNFKFLCEHALRNDYKEAQVSDHFHIGPILDNNNSRTHTQHISYYNIFRTATIPFHAISQCRKLIWRPCFGSTPFTIPSMISDAVSPQHPTLFLPSRYVPTHITCHYTHPYQYTNAQQRYHHLRNSSRRPEMRTSNSSRRPLHTTQR